MWKILIMIAIAFSIAFFIILPKLVIAQDKFPEGFCFEGDIKCIVERYTRVYGVKSEEVLKVLTCESNLQIGAIYGDGGAAYGIAQFHKPTFDLFSKELGKKLDYYSYQDQIELISWAFAHNKKNHWSCLNMVK